MEIIDKQYLLVEFEDSNGIPIAEGEEQTFKIDRKRIMLERKKRKHKNV